MSQLQVSGEAKIRDIQGPVVANSGVITALDGAASQYVRGDGTLADFPTSTGGGSSVSYYLNGSVNQGTFAGSTYYEMSKSPIIGAGTDFPVTTNGLVAQFITDANDPDLLEVPGGNFNVEFYFSVSNNTGNPTVYAELYKYDGTTFTLLGSSVAVPESLNQGTTIAPYYFAIPVGTAALALTDRIAIRIYANVDGRTVTLHTENSHLCQVVTTFSKGMVSLNNLTDQSQFITTGTSGTDFNIVSSGDTHTFNLPVASATNTGKLSSTDWSTFNNKVPYTGATGSVDLGVYSLSAGELNIKKFGTITSAINFEQATGTSIAGAGYTSIGPIGTDGVTFFFGGSTNSLTFKNNLLTSSRTYSLPDTTGTIALTSNLSAYVPYTGAIDNLDLGDYSIISSGLISNGVSTFGGLVRIKQSNSFIGNTVGYTQINSASNTINLDIYNSSSNFKFAILNFAPLSNNTTRTYTFPDASGTIALTSNLSSYVPYTGATTNVDLGIYNIFSSFVYAEGAGGSTNGGILIKQYSGALAANSGYTSLFATPNQLGINFSGVYNTFLQSATLTASRTFTLPDVSGQIAILESPFQVFTGTVQIQGQFNTLYGISMQKGSTPPSFSFGDVFIYAASGTANILKIANNTYESTLSFPTSNQTYTFPAATGTIALTSNLSSYVPYSGATGNVDLGSNYIISSSIVFWKGTGSGLGNIGIGRIVPLGQNTTGQVNIGIGENSLFFNTTGSNNIALGGSANGSNTTGSSNIGIGSSANYANTTASNNIAIGLGALANNTVDNNVAIGHVASYFNTTGNFNVAVGHATLYTNTTGSSNTAIGSNALYSNTTGINNSALGSNSLRLNTTGGNNTAIGVNALQNNTTASFNTAIGNNSLNANTTGASNTAIGSESLISNTTGDSNVSIGATSLNSNTTGQSNVGVGVSSLGVNTIGQYNVAVGRSASNANTTGNYNTALGGQALANVTTGSQNIAIGYNSGGGITTGSQNTIIGTVTGLSSSLSNNIILADGAGNIRYQWNGTNNVFGNPITGTSATFSGSVTAGGYFIAPAAATSGGVSGFLNQYNTGNSSSRSWRTTNDLLVYGDFAIQQSTTQTGSTYANQLYFNATGAATFSSSVTAANYKAYLGGLSALRTYTKAAEVELVAYQSVSGYPFTKTTDLVANADSGAESNFRLLTAEVGGNPTTRLFVSPAGNVGIGTSSPDASDWNASARLLHIYQNTTNGSVIKLESSNASGIVAAFNDAMGVGTLTNDPLLFYTNVTERMRINSGGDIGMGAASITNIRLYVQGATNNSSTQAINVSNSAGTNLFYARNDGYLYSVGAWSGSDIRLKENITDLDNGLQKILGLKAKKFDLKDGLKNNFGFIAQEMQEVIPDAVSVFEEKEQLLAVRMDFIIPHLVKAIQEQQAQIEELKALINK